MNSARLRNRGWSAIGGAAVHPYHVSAEEQELEGRGTSTPSHLVGVEAVIDKDRSSAVLLQDQKYLLVIATDADTV